MCSRDGLLEWQSEDLGENAASPSPCQETSEEQFGLEEWISECEDRSREII